MEPKLKYFKPDNFKRKAKRIIKIAYDVDRHKLVSYDKHEIKTGNVISNDRIIGNTHHGNMITGIKNINKIVFG